MTRTARCPRALALVVAGFLVTCCRYAEPEAPIASSPAPAGDETREPVLAEARAEWPGLRVQVVGSARTGGILSVQLLFVNTSKEPFEFGDRFAADPADRSTLADAAVVDPSGLRKYFVLRDRANRPDSTAVGTPMPAGSRRLVRVRFPAPPERVSRITIQIPHVPPLDVPIVSR